jgi:uncharacterized protein (TIGR00251 family)
MTTSKREKREGNPGPKAIHEATPAATLSVRIQPNASKNEVVGIADNILKIKINAPPVDGKANKECIKFLAKVLDVSKSQVTILGGEKARSKVVRILGISQDICWQRLTSGLRD